MECRTIIYILLGVIVFLLVAFWRHYVNMPDCSIKSEISISPSSISDSQSISISSTKPLEIKTL